MREQESAELADDHAERDAWIRRKRRGFARHLGIYLIVNAAFLAIGLITSNFPGMLMPGVFWSIGLGIHGLRAFMANEDDWAEVRERRRKEDAKRRRREERAAVVGRVVDKGVSLLLGTDRKERRAGPRVDASAAAAAEAARNVRFATGGTRREEAEAEAEALAEEVESRRRGRR